MNRMHTPGLGIITTTLLVLLFWAAPTTWAADEESTEPKITVRTSDENIKIVLEAVAEQSDHNIVIPEDVDRNINVSLKDVPLRQALDSILLVNGFRYVITNRTVLVYSVENAQLVGDFESFPLETRVLKLRHVPAQSVQETVQNLLSARGRIVVVESPELDGWELQGSLSPNGGTQRRTTERSSYTLVVVDESAALDVIERVVREIDQPAANVYISVVIFEMSVSEEEQIGFRWRISGNVSGSSLPWNFPFGSNDIGEYTPTIDPGSDFAPTNPGQVFPDVGGASNADGASTGDSAVPFLFGRLGISGTDLLAELNRLDADFNLVSNPRIMVTNHQEGAILIGERFPILRSNITDEGTLTETFDRYEPIGVQVRVVPHILDDREVELVIHPQITNLGALVVGTTGLTAPRITTREADSKVRVRSGESVVIAGLVTERIEENITRVPYLSRIPFFGRLFTHKSTSKEKIDLVMVVTPYLEGEMERQDTNTELRNAGIDRDVAEDSDDEDK